MDAGKLASYQGVLLAVSVAAALQAVLVARSPTITADGITFISISRQLPASGTQSFRDHDQHPGFPAMLLASTRLLQATGFRAEPESWMRGGQIVSFICGLLSVWVVWLFARDLFGLRAANLAAFIFAVLPVPRTSAADALSDTPHLLFYLLAAWLVSSAIAGGRLLLLAGAGVCSGIAYWIRPEGLEVFVVALGWLVVQALWLHWPWRRLAVAGSVLAATTLLVAAPYFVLAGKLTSKQLPGFIAKVEQLKVAEPLKIAEQLKVAAEPAPAPPAVVMEDQPPPQAPTVAASPAVAESVVRSPPSDPQTAGPPQATVSYRENLAIGLQRLAKAMAAFFASICQGFRWVFLPLYLIGHLELMRRNAGWLRMGFIWALGATHTAVLLTLYLVAGYIAHRHTLPLIALAMPCTALGVIYVGEMLARRLSMAPRYPALAVLGISCAIVLPATLRPFSREFVPVIAATRWVQAHADPGSGIVTNSPYVGFHGTLPVALLGHPAATLDEALTAAPAPARYEFVVLHVNAHGYRPQWLAQIERQYRVVQEFPDPSSGKRAMKVVIFEAKARQARRAAGGSHS